MACRFLCCRFRRENRWGLDAIAKGLRISVRSARRGLHAAELAGLLAVEREPGCKLAVSVLDLPEPEAGPKRRPLYGPIPWSWWLPASRLPGKSLQVASVCWLLAGWNRSAEFELALDDWAEFGLSRFSASRGLDELERAGLVSVGRTPGRSPVVTILDADRGERLMSLGGLADAAYSLPNPDDHDRHRGAGRADGSPATDSLRSVDPIRSFFAATSSCVVVVAFGRRLYRLRLYCAC